MQPDNQTLRALRRGLLGVSLICVLLALVLGVSAAVQLLPPNCGAVGAGAYHPSPIKMPKVVLMRGTVINVTTNSDAINGDTSSVKALLANPGPDGVSLREALVAINKNPGTYTIEFAPSLKGATINVGSADPSVPPFSLISGNVTIDGDIDSDGVPDITINNVLPYRLTGAFVSAFQISSSYNTLYSLNIRNFLNGVQFNPLSSGQTFSNNTLARLNIVSTVMESQGVSLYSGRSAPFWTVQGVSVTRNSWVNTLIINNTTSTQNDGISFAMQTAGDRFNGIQIIGNNVTANAPDAAEIINLDVGFGAGSDGNQVSNVLIAYNHVTGSPFNLIRLSAGSGGGSNNRITGVTISGNDIRAASTTILATAHGNQQGEGTNGVDLVEGDGSSAGTPNSTYSPITYSLNNSVDTVLVAANTVSGFGGYGLWAAGGSSGARNGRISNLLVLGNTFSGNFSAALYGAAGVYVLPAGGSEFSFEQEVSGYVDANVTIKDNTIVLAGLKLQPSVNYGGVILRGGFESANNTLTNVGISSNNIMSAEPGIEVQGGFHTPTTQNSVTQVQISCNSVSGTSSAFSGKVRGIDLAGGTGGANSNTIRGVTLTDNVVGGIMNDFSAFPNATPDSSSNSISLLAVISHYRLLVGQTNYPVTVTTNSSISDLSFSQSSKSLTFAFDGPSTGTSGYVNATFPRSLLNGTLTATANGNPMPSKLTQNGTSYFLYATYPIGTSTLQIAPANPTTTTATSSAPTSTTVSITLPTVSVTTPSATTTSTATASTSSGGGGIPEFPYQLVALTILAFLVVISYLLVRRSKSHTSPRSR